MRMPADQMAERKGEKKSSCSRSEQWGEQMVNVWAEQ